MGTVNLKIRKPKHIMNEEQILKKVLLSTKLFKEPEDNLKNLFDLKGSGIETLLLISYGTECEVDKAIGGFYFLSKDEIWMPFTEKDLLKCPPSLGKKMKIEDLWELSRISQKAGIKRVTNYEYPKPIKTYEIPFEFLESVIKEDKYIILGALNKEELEKRMKGAEELGIPLRNIVIFYDIPTFDPDHEYNFDEYLAGVKLRELGYIVASGSLHGVGVSDDLYGYKCGNHDEGAFLLELLLGKELKKGTTEKDSCYVEAEARSRIFSSNNQGINQLEEGKIPYINKYFISASLAAHYIPHVTELGYGMITFDEEGKIYFFDSKEHGMKRQQDQVLESVSTFISKIAERSEKCPFPIFRLLKS
jgi:hypothetical protein